MSDILLVHGRSRSDFYDKVIVIGEGAHAASFHHCEVRMLQKSVFADDACHWHDDDAVEFLTGVVINKQDLFAERCVTNMEGLLRAMAASGCGEPYLELQGSFVGASVSRGGDGVCAYTDALGNYPLYYYADGEWAIVSNKLTLVASQMRTLGLGVRPNPVGAYSLITYAYMLEDNTLVDGVRRLPVGCRLEIAGGHVNVIRYWDLPEQREPDCSTGEIIDRFDSLFLEAVRLQAAKNDEYGLDNYAALSAGLDSRMTVFALHRLGVRNVVAYTYSESGQLDQRIPQQIAHDLGYEWLYRSLDSGADISRVVEGVALSDCRVYYPWAAQLDGFMRLVSSERMGLVHTGVIGDVIPGTFCHDLSQLSRNYSLGDGAYSHVLIHRLERTTEYDVFRMPYAYGMMHNRAFNGACLGYSTVFQEYTEALSPFMYRPFFEYCVTLPDHMRFGHALYYRWVRERYPQAARYKHNGRSIRRDSPVVSAFGKSGQLLALPSMIVDKALSLVDKRHNMNPLQYWYDTNPLVREAMDGYFAEYIDLIDETRLRGDLVELYQNHTAIDKTLALSLLGYYGVLFDEPGSK